MSVETNWSLEFNHYGFYGYNNTYDDLFAPPPVWFWLAIGICTLMGTYILAPLSLIGNILIIVVMSKPWICNSSTAVLFTALAVTDLLVGVTPVAYNQILGAIYNNFEINVNTDLIIAQSQIIFVGITLKISHTILCLITIERVLSVYFPHKIKTICTSLLAKVAVFCVAVFFLVTEPVIYHVTVDYYFSNISATYREEVPNGILVLNIMYAVFVFGIPIIVTLAGTVLIIVKLHKRNRLLIQNDINSKKKSHVSNSITRSLLVANITFIILQVPAGIMTMSQDCIWPYNDPNKPLSDLALSLVYIFAFLSQFNSGLNFFLYVLSGSRFREEVRKLLCTFPRCRNKARHTSTPSKPTEPKEIS